MMKCEEFYAASNLTENPFRSNPVTDADVRRGVWVGYPSQRDKLTKLLKRSLTEEVGNVNMVMIYGELGVGKSHALLWSQYQVLHAQKDLFNGAAYYIQSLVGNKGKMSFKEAFHSAIVEKSDMINDILRYRQFVEERIVAFKGENGLGPDASWENVATQLIPSLEMLNVLRRILRCDNEEKAREFLAPETDYEAMQLFCRIANLFVHPFVLKANTKQFKSAVYLLIDELDELGNVSAKEAREVNLLLRHIYDLCPRCFFLGLGFTATAAELGVLFANYVIERATATIVLDFLQPDEAKDFVKEILNTARVDPKRKRDYFPFTDGAVEAIVSTLVSITPRKIVNKMQQLIEECRLKGINPATGAITPETLDSHKIWEAID